MQKNAANADEIARLYRKRKKGREQGFNPGSKTLRKAKHLPNYFLAKRKLSPEVNYYTV